MYATEMCKGYFNKHRNINEDDILLKTKLPREASLGYRSVQFGYSRNV